MWPVLVTNDDAANVGAGKPTVFPGALPKVDERSRLSRGPRITMAGTRRWILR